MLNQNCIVAQKLGVILGLETKAFVGVVTSIITLIGASPVRAALITALASPSRVTDAEVGGIGYA